MNLKASIAAALLGLVAGAGCSSGSSTPPKPAAGIVTDTTPTTAKAITFASCAAAKQAGYSAMKRGEAGYSAKLDGDGDGIACDQAAATPAKMTFAECQKQGEYPGGRYAVEFDNGVCTVQKP